MYVGQKAALASGEKLPHSSNRQKGEFTLQGRAVHTDQEPMAHQKISLYAPGFFKQKLLAEGTTDSKGKFKLSFNYSHFGLEKNMNLHLKFLVEKSPSEMSDELRTTYDLPLNLPLDQRKHKVGDVVGKTYEYQPDFPGLKVDEDEERPQQNPKGYFVDVLKAAFSANLKGALATAGDKFLSVQQVQEIFHSEALKADVSEESTLELLLNGIFPGYWRKGEKEGEMINVINWDDYDLDQTQLLPNTKITVQKEGDTLRIKELVIQNRGEEAQVSHPGDEKFLEHLYLFNCSALVRGQAVFHLAMGHLYVEQLAVACYRTLHNNPLKKLLFPHLDGVMEIDRAGAARIFGPTGVLGISKLTTEDVDRLLKYTLGGMDYTNYKTRQPIISSHRFAKAENLFWGVVTKTVDQFFDKNLEGIKAEWGEICDLSTELVKHSLPYRPLEGDPKKEGFEWCDEGEIDNSLEGRVTYKGELKALRPITKSADAPRSGEIEKLKQFSRDALFKSTFWHWAVHMETKWATKLDVSSLAPETSDYHNLGDTKVDNAINQLNIANTLISFNRPESTLAHGEGIYADFRENLLKEKEAFLALGYDVEKIFSCVNI